MKRGNSGTFSPGGVCIVLYRDHKNSEKGTLVASIFVVVENNCAEGGWRVDEPLGAALTIAMRLLSACTNRPCNASFTVSQRYGLRDCCIYRSRVGGPIRQLIATYSGTSNFAGVFSRVRACVQ